MAICCFYIALDPVVSRYISITVLYPHCMRHTPCVTSSPPFCQSLSSSGEERSDWPKRSVRQAVTCSCVACVNRPGASRGSACKQALRMDERERQKKMWPWMTRAITSCEMRLDRTSICQNRLASADASLMAADACRERERGG
ncbi:hypothetical protein SRHO_G00226510 [Serrasalmus rhombeus]